MNAELPGLVVTGASGFVGKHVLASLAGRYRLFCLARRSRVEAGVPEYEDLRWTQVDIARWETMRDVVNCIKDHGGADYVLHLAGYYDFHNMENPEYDRTNVEGTRNVLKLARKLGVKRFLFASSLAACSFPESGCAVDEETPADADFAYARSKRIGEDLVLEQAEWFPSAIVRMAAVYSDWCEYPPLYVFLRTWLSSEWNARILGGRGESAVTYIHVQDLVRLFHRIIERSDDLPRTRVYNASPNHVSSHRDLYDASTGFFYADPPAPRFLPKGVCLPGVVLRAWLGRLMGDPPFEAPWMIRYIDRQLRVDSTRTQQELEWSPTPRLGVERRLLMMIENMTSNPEVWRQRNEAALRRVARRPHLLIADRLEETREEMVDRIFAAIREPAHGERFRRYRGMDAETLRWFLALLYQVLIASARVHDRHLMRQYAQVIAVRRRAEGIEAAQVQDMLEYVGEVIVADLGECEELADLGQHVHDNVGLGFQLAVDAVEDAYAEMAARPGEIPDRLGEIELPETARDLQLMVRQMENICEDVMPASLR